MKQTMDDLLEMQKWNMGRKIRVSQTRILEWCLEYDWEVYVSFSGGKDSCVLADLVARVWKSHGVKKPLPLVFSDTGMEYIDIIKHLDTFKRYLEDTHNIEVELVKVRSKENTHKVYKEIGYPILSKKIARQLRDLSNPKDTNYNSRRLYITGIKTDGTKSKSFRLAEKWQKLFDVDKENYTVDLPFKVSEQCCNYFKKDPLKGYEQETNKKTFVGTMADDSQARRQSWLVTGCNNFSSKNGQSKPISFWLEQDVLTYIRDFKIPISRVYGDIVENEDELLETTGEHNTGCKYCMFGVHMEKGETRFERLKKLEPNSYDYAMRDEKGLGMGKVLDFLGIRR